MKLTEIALTASLLSGCSAIPQKDAPQAPITQTSAEVTEIKNALDAAGCKHDKNGNIIEEKATIGSGGFKLANSIGCQITPNSLLPCLAFKGVAAIVWGMADLGEAGIDALSKGLNNNHCSKIAAEALENFKKGQSR